MSIEFENECVHCDVCYGCGRKEVPHYYCNICGDEVTEYDDELCEDCKEKLYDEEHARAAGDEETVGICLNGFDARAIGLDNRRDKEKVISCLVNAFKTIDKENPSTKEDIAELFMPIYWMFKTNSFNETIREYLDEGCNLSYAVDYELGNL